MSVPNLQAIVQAVRDSQPWPFSTKDQLCAYSHAVIVALHAADPNFGKLKKAPEQNHCVDPSGSLGAVDVALYRPTGQIVDFISSAGYGDPPPPNAVAWGVGPEGEYGPDDWFAPGGSTPEPPISDIEDRVVVLEALFPELLHQIGILNQQLADLDAAVVKQPLPDYVGKLWGFTITSRPKV